MVGWHHQLDGLEFEQTSGAGDGQGSQAGCSPWGQKSRTQLNPYPTPETHAFKGDALAFPCGEKSTGKCLLGSLLPLQG